MRLSQNSASKCYSIYVAIVDILGRAVARSENLGGNIALGGDNVPPWLI